MELTCAYIFLLFSAISATPHGYGVKGGASAKAEASATAGAFGDVRGLPLSIPSGSGYSGSFSKSSSSSFSSASSSASSSSSSFTYNGSGSAGLHDFGANGIAGANSVAGANGLAGANGIAGANNIAGANGLAGANSLAEANIISGGNGLAGTNGLAGAHGHAEANGLAGANGLATANGLAETNGHIGGNGLPDANGLAGCGSGACSHNKFNGIPSLHGSGGAATGQGYSGANAAAAASSNAVAGTYGLTNGGGKTCVGNDCSNPSSGCHGSDCLSSDTGNKCTSGQCGFESSKKDEDCSSGKCGHAPQSGPVSSNYQSPTQCTSGQCGLNVQTNLPTTTAIGSYDIPAKKYDTTLTSGSKDQTDKAFTGYNGASSQSHSKSFGGIGDSLSHSGNLGGYNQAHGVPKCDNPNCNAYDSTASTSSPSSGLPIGHTKPATYLTTPKVEAPCNSPTCGLDFSTNTGKPSSYNVPLHTSLDVPKQDLPCYNGNCGNNQFKNHYPTQSVGPLSPEQAGPITCTSPNCAERPTNFGSECNSPNCGPNYASAPTGSGVGLIYPPGIPSSVLIPTNPSYASPVVPTFNPAHGHFNPDCKTPDCAGHINAGSDSEAHSQSGILPSGSSPTIPSYSTPVLIPSKPTIGHTPHIPSNTGHYGGINSPTAVTQEHKHATGSYDKGFGGPIGILKPNEFNVPSNTHVLGTSHTGPAHGIKPSVGASSPAEEIPPYTGGFGDPQGLLKPNEFDIKHPSTTHNTPASGIGTSGQNIPAYTGGFGAPSGLLKPNEISSSAHAGATANSNAGTFGAISPNNGVATSVQKVPIHHGTYAAPSGTPGIDTNVGITPVVHLGTPVVLQPITAGYPTIQALPAHTGGLVPIGAVQPNAYFNSNPNIAVNPNIPSGHIVSHGLQGYHGHTQLTSGENTVDKNSPKYTGGFGGPAGALKPNDFKDSSSIAYNKPETPSGTKPATCASGTCDVVSSNAVAVAKADAAAYTGGFGGPSGLLTPLDNRKPDGKVLSGSQLGLQHSATGLVNTGIGSSGKVDGDEANVPAHATYGQSGAAAQANAVAQASATAGATSGSFGGNNAYSSGQTGSHGVGENSGGGCGGGCGSGSHHGSGSNFGSSSALSIAKAGVVDGADSGLHGNGASAKSLASAVSGARAFGGAGSYASSSASAHASAGYATKGGYGK